MITTELTSAADPNARPILAAAGRLKIPFFKLGYWRYGTDVLADVRKAAGLLEPGVLEGSINVLRRFAAKYGARFHRGRRNGRIGTCG